MFLRERMWKNLNPVGVVKDGQEKYCASDRFFGYFPCAYFPCDSPEDETDHHRRSQTVRQTRNRTDQKFLERERGKSFLWR